MVLIFQVNLESKWKFKIGIIFIMYNRVNELKEITDNSLLLFIYEK